jgi:hypothetical protein
MHAHYLNSSAEHIALRHNLVSLFRMKTAKLPYGCRNSGTGAVLDLLTPR